MNILQEPVVDALKPGWPGVLQRPSQDIFQRTLASYAIGGFVVSRERHFSPLKASPEGVVDVFLKRDPADGSHQFRKRQRAMVSIDVKRFSQRLVGLQRRRNEVDRHTGWAMLGAARELT